MSVSHSGKCVIHVHANSKLFLVLNWDRVLFLQKYALAFKGDLDEFFHQNKHTLAVRHTQREIALKQVYLTVLRIKWNVSVTAQ